jgi:hypothetical protein
VFPFANVLDFLKGVHNVRTWLSALLFDLDTLKADEGGSLVTKGYVAGQNPI